MLYCQGTRHLMYHYLLGLTNFIFLVEVNLDICDSNFNVILNIANLLIQKIILVKHINSV